MEAKVPILIVFLGIFFTLFFAIKKHQEDIRRGEQCRPEVKGLIDLYCSGNTNVTIVGEYTAIRFGKHAIDLESQEAVYASYSWDNRIKTEAAKRVSDKIRAAQEFLDKERPVERPVEK